MGSVSAAPRRRWRAAGPVCVGTVVVAVACNVAPLLFPLHGRVLVGGGRDLVAGIGLIAFAVLGWWVTSQRPGNRVGWVLSAVGAVGVVEFLVLGLFAGYALDHRGLLPGGTVAASLAATGPAPVLALLAVVLPLHFPSGRPLAGASRVVAWIAVGAALIAQIARVFDAHALSELGRRNLYAVPGPVVPVLVSVAAATLLGSVLVSAVLVTRRFRRARGEERQQLRWFAWAVAVMGAAVIGSALGTAAGIPAVQGFTPLAAAVLLVAIGMAVLKYRLYELDLFVNRALVYGLVTVTVVSGYLGIVTAVGAAAGPGRASSVGAVVVVALVVAPLRSLLQQGVNRLMYGQRHDPFSVVTLIGQRLAQAAIPAAVLPAVLDSVGRALRLSFLQVDEVTKAGPRPLAVWGAARADPLQLPLCYQGEVIGQLLVVTDRGDRLTGTDRQLLDDLAPHIAAVVHGLRLTGDLRASRERLVAAREEERRRLRRDLHDNLGSRLTGLALQLEIARNRVGTDPAAAGALLDRLKTDTQAAITDIRRLVDGLRPPALDQLGLLSALRQQASRLGCTVNGPGGLTITLSGEDPVLGLPAAVEVAAYQIVTEALTNVVKHAQATRCDVLLALTDTFDVQIRDDGGGLPAGYRAGFGLISMRERAAELGGTCVVDSVPSGGTRVLARLPIPAT